MKFMNKLKIVCIICLQILFFQNSIYSQKIIAPEDGCYHAAFVGSDLQSTFEQLSGKNIAIEMFFTGWPSNKISDFPEAKCNTIVANGAIPHITWMFEVSGTPFPLDAILNGSYDSYIIAYANQVKAWGKQLFIRPGHEMNGDWYKYGGQNNGGGTLNGYGDPNKADGPERFIAAYRRIVDLFNQQGVLNVTWVWCPNNGSAPDATWNTYDAYYPGDEYVDWVGMDGYNFGTSQSWSAWLEYFSIYNNFYHALEVYNKPMMIGEYASVEDAQNVNRKANWITNAYLYTKVVFKKIKAITWFHIKKYENGILTDWRINSSTNSLEAYKTALSDSYFISSIITKVEDDQSIKPQDYNLLAYPNPFNPNTRINFQIPKAGFVSIKIYDILGRKVAVLVEENKSAGVYSVEFNAPQLSSGLYLCRMKTDNFTQTIKLIYQK